MNKKFNIREWKDTHIDEAQDSSSGKIIKEHGWEIALLMAELTKKKFGLKVEAWVEANKDKRLGPSRAGFYDLLSSLERMKDMLK